MFEDLSIAKRKLIASLRQAKHRREEGLFVVEGEKSVLDNIDTFDFTMIAGRAGWLEKNAGMLSNLMSRANDNRSSEIIKRPDIFKASAADMERMTALSTAPEVIALCRIPRYSFSTDCLKSKLTVALDGLQDPGNLGTIVRTCDWFGIDTILCSKSTVDIYNPKAIQATMGALARVKLHYVDLPQALADCGVPVYGTFMDGESIYSLDQPLRGVLVMGNEGRGISPEVASTVTHRLTIPAGEPVDRRHVESLNVAIATAIILSHGKN